MSFNRPLIIISSMVLLMSNFGHYYQGRIYQNKGDDDAAMQSFMRGKEYCQEATDTLIMANLMVAQGSIQYSIYKIDEFINNNLEAANLS